MAGTKKAFSVCNSPSSPSSPKKGTLTSVAVSSTLSECDYIDISGFRFVAIKPPASVTAITVYAAETIDGTFVIVDTLGTSGAITVVASKWNVIDTAKLSPFSFVQFLSNQTVANASLVAST